MGTCTPLRTTSMGPEAEPSQGEPQEKRLRAKTHPSQPRSDSQKLRENKYGLFKPSHGRVICYAAPGNSDMTLDLSPRGAVQTLISGLGIRK